MMNENEYKLVTIINVQKVMKCSLKLNFVLTLIEIFFISSFSTIHGLKNISTKNYR